jgi:hypothetical protein
MGGLDFHTHRDDLYQLLLARRFIMVALDFETRVISSLNQIVQGLLELLRELLLVFGQGSLWGALLDFCNHYFLFKKTCE